MAQTWSYADPRRSFQPGTADIVQVASKVRRYDTWSNFQPSSVRTIRSS